MSNPAANHPVVALMKELLAVPCPSGREERLAALVRAKIESFGYACETDPSGNLLVRLDGGQPDLPLMMIASHIDEIGMVVTAIDNDGTLQVNRSGLLHPYKIGERPVSIVGDRELVPGLTSIVTPYGRDAGQRSVGWEDVRIITGLSPKRLAELGVRVGSTAVPTSESRGPVLLGEGEDPLIASWTFDDRGGVMTLIRLLENLKRNKLKPVHPTIIAFTVHEEGGCHGAKNLAHRENPGIFLAIDGCPAMRGSNIVADARPCVWSMDMKGHYDQRLVRDMISAARDSGTELQIVIQSNAYSDASAVYDAGAAPRVAILGHSRENSHGYEVARLSVFDNVLNVLERFIQTAH